MAEGDTQACDRLNCCLDISSSEPALEDQQVAVDRLEASHQVVSHTGDAISALPAALFADVCIFVARSFFITVCSNIASDRMRVCQLGLDESNPGREDLASRGGSGCPGNATISSDSLKVVLVTSSKCSNCCLGGSISSSSHSSSSSTFVDSWARWRPSLVVSHGGLKIKAANRPSHTCGSSGSSGSCSSCCDSRSDSSKSRDNVGNSRSACERCSSRRRGEGSLRFSSNSSSGKRSSRNCSASWSYSDVVWCAMVVSLVVEVCSAACLDKTNCSSAPVTPTGRAYINDTLTSIHPSLGVGNTPYADQHRTNHSRRVKFPTQDFVLQETVLTTEQLSNLEASKHFTHGFIAEAAFLSATKPAAPIQDDNEDFSKIIGVVIPFVCVIVVALVLCIAWKLCRKYKCCDNEACLQKCSALCDSCMSAPYAFQAPSHIKVQNQMSRDTTGLTSVSQNRPSSISHLPRSAGSIVRPPHSKLSVPSHGGSSVSVSRHGSSRSGRHIVTNAHGARQSTHSPRHTSGQVSATQPKVAYASVHQNDT